MSSTATDNRTHPKKVLLHPPTHAVMFRAHDDGNVADAAVAQG